MSQFKEVKHPQALHVSPYSLKWVYQGLRGLTSFFSAIKRYQTVSVAHGEAQRDPFLHNCEAGSPWS